MAGDARLVSSERLVSWGWLSLDAHGPALQASSAPDVTKANFQVAREERERALRASFGRVAALSKESRARVEWTAFEDAERDWLFDWARFRVLKSLHGGAAWSEWPDVHRDREARALERLDAEWAGELAFERFVQWVFARQWAEFRTECARLGLRLLGDAPIFVAHDSADVWAHRDLFELDANGSPLRVAGVPSDYFSATGQLWGNPLYRWERHAADGFAWWKRRVQKTLERFNAVRLDHFIGFHNYWAVPAEATSAVDGEWVQGPGASFFEAMRDALGDLPFLAEDLGVVTLGVSRLRDEFDLPGLRVLQFAFGADPAAPSFRPHVYPRRTVACTGTHDNDTVVGWFTDPGGRERSPAEVEQERLACLEYLGTEGREIHWEMIREVMKSVACLSLFPLQDILGLGTQARMNRPGTASGNWTWRFSASDLTLELAERLKRLGEVYDRR